MKSINFLTVKKDTTKINYSDPAVFAEAMDRLKHFGVIKGFNEVVKGTKFHFSNVTAFKHSRGPAPIGFLTHFEGKYGAKLLKLWDKPLPDKKAYKANRNELTRLQERVGELEERLKEKDAIIADKLLIIQLLQKKK